LQPSRIAKWPGHPNFVSEQKLDFAAAPKLILLVAFSWKKVDFRQKTWPDGRFTASVKLAFGT
jgi:hypothetical protein